MSNTANSAKSLLGRVLKSVFYAGALAKAPKILKNRTAILQLLFDSLKKTQKLTGKGMLTIIKERILIIAKLIKLYLTGDYRQVETSTLLKIIGGLLYFVSPIDLIPDFLPMIGMADDIALLSYILSNVEEEITKFEQWLKRQPIKI